MTAITTQVEKLPRRRIIARVAIGRIVCMAGKYRAARLRRIYIREWLEELDMRQVDLADLMGTDPANVNRWITQPHRVTNDVISGIADALAIKSPELAADAGHLYRHPLAARAVVALQEAARTIVDAEPPPRPRPPKRRR